MAGMFVSLVLTCLLCSNGIGHSQASVVRSSKLQDRLSFILDVQEFEVRKSQAQTHLLKIVSPPEDDVMIDKANGTPARHNNTSRLQLASDELIGDCVKKTCTFCSSKYFKFCLVAKLLDTGFELEVSVNGIRFFSAKIVDPTFKPVCAKVTLVGHICVTVNNINLKERSACVGVEFQAPVFKKEVKFQIACFKIGNNRMEPTLDQLLLAWQMKQKVPVTRP